ncbi:hypothetical protein CQW23_09938 [Capsicum baccatum]|uniref:Uncharacterized protein n=1 Tax=Capsicum baccatum TaxID=33114 RepID=A0A2G2WYB1_CAPBA|nr:hypothetical protein CQW23_09938 [Capsicum baccatum]
MIRQIIEVEKLAKMKVEKLKLEMELTEYQGELNIFKEQLKKSKNSLVEKLKAEIVKLKEKLSTAYEATRNSEAEVDPTSTIIKDLVKCLEEVQINVVELQA